MNYWSQVLKKIEAKYENRVLNKDKSKNTISFYDSCEKVKQLHVINNNIVLVIR